MEWVLLIVLGLCLYVLAVMALGQKRTKGKAFARIPGTDKAVMAPNSKGEMVRVELPEGVTVDKVDAVFVGKKPEKAKVVLYHEKTDRRNSSGSTGHDMDIYSYEPLTDEEVLSYWGGLTKEQRIEEIRKLDAIEHITPEIVLTAPVAVLTGRDVTFYYLPGENVPEPLQVNVGPYLSYGIELDPVTFKGLIPNPLKDYIKIGAVSATAGGLAVWLLMIIF